MGKRVKLPGRVESAEMGGIVTGAGEILDDLKGKTQEVINTETDAELVRLDETKQGNLTFDQTPTENSTNPVTSGGVYAADQLLSQAIEAILLLIPSAASALNKLVDLATMNSSISTATASFKGTYNLVSDLHLTVSATHAQIAAALDALSLGADNNDYAFVQVPNTELAHTDIKKTERYKFNGTNWAYEYDLNNSGFTSAQWAAINSNITTVLVSKLSALPTNEALTALLAAKQDNLTFDDVPTSGSNNPVKSGGIYTRNNEIIAMITALDAAKQDVLTFDITPTENSTNPVTSNGVYQAIYLVQAALAALDGRMLSAEHSIELLTEDVGVLRTLYQALSQSDIIVGALPATGVANTVYRVPGTSTYADWMYYNGAWVKLAEYTTLDGYLYKGIATPTSSPAASADKMFYFALTAGTYTNFGNLVVKEGISILKYDGANWTQDKISYMDGGVFDVTAYSGREFASLSALMSDANLNNLIPTAVRKGGMSIKFVESSDHKYVCCNLLAQSFTTDVTQWQKEDMSEFVQNAISNNDSLNKLIIELYFEGNDVNFSLYNKFTLSNKVNGNITFKLEGPGVANVLIQIPDTTNTFGFAKAKRNGYDYYVYGIFDFSSLTVGESYIFNSCTVSNRCKNISFSPTIKTFIDEENLQKADYGLVPVALYDKDSIPQWDTTNKTLKFADKTNLMFKDGSRFTMPTAAIALDETTIGSVLWKLYYDSIGGTLVPVAYNASGYDSYRYVLVAFGRSNTDVVHISCGYKFSSPVAKQSYFVPIQFGDISTCPNWDSVNRILTFYPGTRFLDSEGGYNVYQTFASTINISLTEQEVTNIWKLYIDTKLSSYNTIVWKKSTAYTEIVDVDRYKLVAIGNGAGGTITMSCIYTIDKKFPPEIKVKGSYLRKVGYDNQDMIYTYWLYPQVSRANYIRDALYLGFANSQKESGIAQYDITQKTFKRNSMLISSRADDHNAMATFVLDDGRILAAGSIHGLEDYLHIYISDSAQNIEDVSTDIKVQVYQASYAQIFKKGNRYIILTRSGAGTDSKWFAVYSDDLENWTVKAVIDAPNKKYYLCARDVTDNPNIIRLVMYENPSSIDADTNIRMGFLNASNGNIYDADGTTVLGTWSDSIGIDQSDFTSLIDKGADYWNRLYDVAITAMNNPVIAYCEIHSSSLGIYKVYKNGSEYNPCSSNYDTVSYSFGGMSFVGSENKVVASYHRTEQNDSDIVEVFEYNISDNNYISSEVLATVPRQGTKDVRELRPICDKDGEFVVTFKGYYKYNSFFDWQTDIEIYDIR